MIAVPVCDLLRQIVLTEGLEEPCPFSAICLTTSKNVYECYIELMKTVLDVIS